MLKFWKSNEDLREDIVGAIDELIRENVRLDNLVKKMREKLDRPNDERLAQAYAIIDEMKEEYDKLDRKSFITMNDAQYKELEEWKLNHWKENKSCQRKGLKFVRTFENGTMEVMCNICGASITIGEERREHYPTVVRDCKSLRNSK